MAGVSRAIFERDLIGKPGGSKLPLVVVDRHVMHRYVGWTRTTLRPVGAQLALVLNLFEEAFNETVQNVRYNV